MTTFDDRKEVEITPEGVFHITHHRLSLSALKARRTRLQGEILELHRDITSLQRNIKRIGRKLQRKEEELAFFNSPTVLDWVDRREHELIEEKEQKRREKAIANEKAQQFLQKYLGEEAYAELKKRNYLQFQAQGRAYRISSKGELSRITTRGEKKHICVVRPRNLPLPDYILSILRTVKEGRLG